jgi:signal transduction histidine kinase
LLALAPTWLMLVGTLSLCFRRALPMTVMVIAVSALILSAEIHDTGSGWIAAIIASFSAGLQGPPRRNVVLGITALLAIALTYWASTFGAPRFDPVLPGIVALAAGIMWAGSALRMRTRQAADLRADTVRLQLEREHAAERAAAAERSRIARELHDVIAHSLSVVVIQAAAARRMLDTDPERARESLDAVEQTGRSAMLEMRRLLGVVRRDERDAPPIGEGIDSASAPRVPQPSVSELGRVVADMRQAGLDVTLRIDGETRELPSGVDVSAYRIVQEALTNVRRHSPGAKAEVLIRYQPHELEIRIEDDGAGRLRARHAADPELSADRELSSGHGLVGMRERVALLRGELEVGPRPESGFAVHARLPLDWVSQ